MGGGGGGGVGGGESPHLLICIDRRNKGPVQNKTWHPRSRITGALRGAGEELSKTVLHYTFERIQSF